MQLLTFYISRIPFIEVLFFFHYSFLVLGIVIVMGIAGAMEKAGVIDPDLDLTHENTMSVVVNVADMVRDLTTKYQKELFHLLVLLADHQKVRKIIRYNSFVICIYLNIVSTR